MHLLTHCANSKAKNFSVRTSKNVILEEVLLTYLARSSKPSKLISMIQRVSNCQLWNANSNAKCLMQGVMLKC